MSTLELVRIEDEQARQRKLIDMLVGEVARLQEEVQLLRDALEHPEPGARPKKGAQPK
jgi:uncharacterized coiled-coil protein SlyX